MNAIDVPLLSINQKIILLNTILLRNDTLKLFNGTVH